MASLLVPERFVCRHSAGTPAKLRISEAACGPKAFLQRNAAIGRKVQSRWSAGVLELRRGNTAARIQSVFERHSAPPRPPTKFRVRPYSGTS